MLKNSSALMLMRHLSRILRARRDLRDFQNFPDRPPGL
jgi:hypothetical protein